MRRFSSVPSEREPLVNNGPRRISKPINWNAVTLGAIAFIALAGLAIALGGLIRAETRGPHHDPSQVENLNVTGNLTALKAIVESLMSQNVTMENLKIFGTFDLGMAQMVIPQMWMMPPIPPTKRNTRSTVTYNVLPGNQAILLGSQTNTYEIQFPKNMQSYVQKDYYIFSNSSLPHTVRFTGAINPGPCNAPYQETTFDEDRQFPVAKFDARPGCYVHFKVVDCGTIMMIESRCVDYCNEIETICVHPRNDVNASWAFIENGSAVDFNVTGSFMTDIVMNSVLLHEASGVIPPTHAIQHMSGASFLNMTLPATLSSYIGKKITICSISGKQDMVMLSGGQSWSTPKGSAPVKYAIFNGTQPCCFTFLTHDSQTVSILSQDQCVVFSPSLFGGWWIRQTKDIRAIESSSSYPLVFINDANWPSVTIQGYLQAPTVLRESGRLTQTGYLPLNDTVLSRFGNDDFQTLTGLPVLNWQSANGYLSSGLFQSNYVDFEPYFFVSILKRQPNDVPLPEIIPSETGLSTGRGHPDSPRAAIYYMSETFLTEINSHTGVVFNDEQFIGFTAARNLRNAILNTGITHVTDIYSAFVTSFPSIPVTRLRLVDYPHVNIPTRVTISGFTGDYAVLNGEHDVSFAGTTNIPSPDSDFMDYHPSNPALRTMHHDVTIFFNTTGLPAHSNGTAIFTGAPKLTVKYGPFFDESTWGKTNAAFTYWMVSTFGELEHTSIRMYFSPTSAIGGGPFETHKTLQEWVDVESNFISPQAFFNRIVTGLRDRSVQDYYSNPSFGISYFDAFGDIYGTLDTSYLTVDVNNRFGLRPDIGLYDDADNLWYDIGIENYLLNVSYVAYRTIGTLRTGPDNILAQMYYPGAEGDTFDFILVNRGDDPPYPYSPMNSFGFSAYDYPLDSISKALAENDIVIGVVKSEFTGSETVGYIRIRSFLFSDLFYIFSNGREFSPDDFIGTSLEGIGAVTLMYVEIMNHLKTVLGCTQIIFDFRMNIGGWEGLGIALRNTMGSDSYIPILYDTKPSFETGLSFNISNLEIFQDTILYNKDTLKIQPDLVEQKFPGVTFTNGKIVVLTSQATGSAASLVLSQFLGNTGDKELGSNTTVKIFGNIHGRNVGFYCTSGSSTDSVVSLSDSRLRSVSGTPIPVIRNPERECGSVGIRTFDGSSMGNRIIQLKPDAAPSLTGLSGGTALPDDFETLLHPDLGLVSNSRPRLPGDTRPQTPNFANRTEWRDAWLEQAILEASIGSKKRRNTAKKSLVPRKAPRVAQTPRNVKRILEHAQRRYKKDVSCPAGQTLVNLHDAPKTINITVPDEYGEKKREYMHNATSTAAQIIDHEMRIGGLCVDSTTGHIMVTPQCQGLPNIIHHKKTISKKKRKVTTK